MSADSPRLPPPANYFPFAASPPGRFRQAMGLKDLPPDEWIELDAAAPSQLAAKRALLRDEHAAVLAALPRAWAASLEGLHLLADHLVRRFPHWYSRRDGLLTNHLTGESWPLPAPDAAERAGGMYPLELAGRLVQEDWCVMEDVAGVSTLTAGCVCFPSRWSLAEKLGRPMGDIHGPVPFFADQIGRPADRFMAAIKPDRPVWRVNWSLHDGPDLFRPTAPPMWAVRPLEPADVPDRVWLRVERQTLRRLPATGAVLFGIRTHVRPLADLAARPEVAAGLGAVLRGWPAAVVAYKGCGRSVGPTVAWLDTLGTGFRPDG